MMTETLNKPQSHVLSGQRAFEELDDIASDRAEKTQRLRAARLAKAEEEKAFAQTHKPQRHGNKG